VQDELLDQLVRDATNLDEIDMPAAEAMARERLPSLRKQ
jgi:hypothetical protein